MSDPSSLSLEPLADYLAPQFGNIYDCDVGLQAWTPELLAAVGHYFRHELPPELRKPLVAELAASGLSGEDIESLLEEIANLEPWEVAYAVHRAAVIACPSLESIIGHLMKWRFEDERQDAALWLATHGPSVELEYLAVDAGEHWAAEDDRECLAEKVARAFEPPSLLAAWQELAKNDISDEEWRLLQPLVPTAGRYSKEELDRRISATVNGMLYIDRVGLRWDEVPRRYLCGRLPAALKKWYDDRLRFGDFEKLLRQLGDTPEASRIVEWLKRAIARKVVRGENGTKGGDRGRSL